MTRMDNNKPNTAGTGPAGSDGAERMASSGTPLGNCSPDEPANTLPAEPVSIARMKSDKVAKPSSVGAASDAERTGIREAPALHQESDIPSDGPDPEGEAMIRQLPKRTGPGKPGADDDKGRAG